MNAEETLTKLSRNKKISIAMQFVSKSTSTFGSLSFRIQFSQAIQGQSLADVRFDYADAAFRIYINGDDRLREVVNRLRND